MSTPNPSQSSKSSTIHPYDYYKQLENEALRREKAASDRLFEALTQAPPEESLPAPNPPEPTLHEQLFTQFLDTLTPPPQSQREQQQNMHKLSIPFVKPAEIISGILEMRNLAQQERISALQAQIEDISTQILTKQSTLDQLTYLSPSQLPLPESISSQPSPTHIYSPHTPPQLDTNASPPSSHSSQQSKFPPKPTPYPAKPPQTNSSPYCNPAIPISNDFYQHFHAFYTLHTENTPYSNLLPSSLASFHATHAPQPVVRTTHQLPNFEQNRQNLPTTPSPASHIHASSFSHRHPHAEHTENSNWDHFNHLCVPEEILQHIICPAFGLTDFIYSALYDKLILFQYLWGDDKENEFNTTETALWILDQAKQNVVNPAIHYILPPSSPQPGRSQSASPFSTQQHNSLEGNMSDQLDNTISTCPPNSLSTASSLPQLDLDPDDLCDVRFSNPLQHVEPGGQLFEPIRFDKFKSLGQVLSRRRHQHLHSHLTAAPGTTTSSQTSMNQITHATDSHPNLAHPQSPSSNNHHQAQQSHTPQQQQQQQQLGTVFQSQTSLSQNRNNFKKTTASPYKDRVPFTSPIVYFPNIIPDYIDPELPQDSITNQTTLAAEKRKKLSTFDIFEHYDSNSTLRRPFWPPIKLATIIRFYYEVFYSLDLNSRFFYLLLPIYLTPDHLTQLKPLPKLVLEAYFFTSLTGMSSFLDSLYGNRSVPPPNTALQLCNYNQHIDPHTASSNRQSHRNTTTPTSSNDSNKLANSSQSHQSPSTLHRLLFPYHKLPFLYQLSLSQHEQAQFASKFSNGEKITTTELAQMQADSYFRAMPHFKRNDDGDGGDDEDQDFDDSSDDDGAGDNGMMVAESNTASGQIQGQKREKSEQKKRSASFRVMVQHERNSRILDRIREYRVKLDAMNWELRENGKETIVPLSNSQLVQYFLAIELDGKSVSSNTLDSDSEIDDSDDTMTSEDDPVTTSTSGSDDDSDGYSTSEDDSSDVDHISNPYSHSHPNSPTPTPTSLRKSIFPSINDADSSSKNLLAHKPINKLASGNNTTQKSTKLRKTDSSTSPLSTDPYNYGPLFDEPLPLIPLSQLIITLASDVDEDSHIYNLTAAELIDQTISFHNSRLRTLSLPHLHQSLENPPTSTHLNSTALQAHHDDIKRALFDHLHSQSEEKENKKKKNNNKGINNFNFPSSSTLDNTKNHNTAHNTTTNTVNNPTTHTDPTFPTPAPLPQTTLFPSSSPRVNPSSLLHSYSNPYERTLFEEIHNRTPLFSFLSPFLPILTPKTLHSLQLTRLDFIPLINTIQKRHRCLQFLYLSREFGSRYTTTVISRLFYHIKQPDLFTLPLKKFAQTELVALIKVLSLEGTTYKLHGYFSYEEFYVICSTFWGFNINHNMLLDSRDLFNINNATAFQKLSQIQTNETPALKITPSPNGQINEFAQMSPSYFNFADEGDVAGTGTRMFTQNRTPNSSISTLTGFGGLQGGSQTDVVDGMPQVPQIGPNINNSALIKHILRYQSYLRSHYRQHDLTMEERRLFTMTMFQLQKKRIKKWLVHAIYHFKREFLAQGLHNALIDYNDDDFDESEGNLTKSVKSKDGKDDPFLTLAALIARNSRPDEQNQTMVDTDVFDPTVKRDILGQTKNETDCTHKTRKIGPFSPLSHFSNQFGTLSSDPMFKVALKRAVGASLNAVPHIHKWYEHSLPPPSSLSEHDGAHLVKPELLMVQQMGRTGVDLGRRSDRHNRKTAAVNKCSESDMKMSNHRQFRSQNKQGRKSTKTKKTINNGPSRPHSSNRPVLFSLLQPLTSLISHEFSTNPQYNPTMLLPRTISSSTSTSTLNPLIASHAPSSSNSRDPSLTSTSTSFPLDHLTSNPQNASNLSTGTPRNGAFPNSPATPNSTFPGPASSIPVQIPDTNLAIASLRATSPYNNVVDMFKNPFTSQQPTISNLPYFSLNTHTNTPSVLTISYQEFIPLFISYIDRSTPQSLSYWFNRLDVNHDGFISSEDIMTFYQQQASFTTQLQAGTTLLDHRKGVALKDLQNGLQSPYLAGLPTSPLQTASYPSPPLSPMFAAQNSNNSQFGQPFSANSSFPSFPPQTIPVPPNHLNPAASRQYLQQLTYKVMESINGTAENGIASSTTIQDQLTNQFDQILALPIYTNVWTGFGPMDLATVIDMPKYIQSRQQQTKDFTQSIQNLITSSQYSQRVQSAGKMTTGNIESLRYDPKHVDYFTTLANTLLSPHSNPSQIQQAYTSAHSIIPSISPHNHLLTNHLLDTILSPHNRPLSHTQLAKLPQHRNLYRLLRTRSQDTESITAKLWNRFTPTAVLQIMSSIFRDFTAKFIHHFEQLMELDQLMIVLYQKYTRMLEWEQVDQLQENNNSSNTNINTNNSLSSHHPYHPPRTLTLPELLEQPYNYLAEQYFTYKNADSFNTEFIYTRSTTSVLPIEWQLAPEPKIEAFHNKTVPHPLFSAQRLANTHGNALTTSASVGNINALNHGSGGSLLSKFHSNTGPVGTLGMSNLSPMNPMNALSSGMNLGFHLGARSTHQLNNQLGTSTFTTSSGAVTSLHPMYLPNDHMVDDAMIDSIAQNHPMNPQEFEHLALDVHQINQYALQLHLDANNPSLSDFADNEGGNGKNGATMDNSSNTDNTHHRNYNNNNRPDGNGGDGSHSNAGSSKNQQNQANNKGSTFAARLAKLTGSSDGGDSGTNLDSNMGNNSGRNWNRSNQSGHMNQQQLQLGYNPSSPPRSGLLNQMTAGYLNSDQQHIGNVSKLIHGIGGSAIGVGPGNGLFTGTTGNSAEDFDLKQNVTPVSSLHFLLQKYLNKTNNQAQHWQSVSMVGPEDQAMQQQQMRIVEQIHDSHQMPSGSQVRSPSVVTDNNNLSPTSDHFTAPQNSEIDATSASRQIDIDGLDMDMIDGIIASNPLLSPTQQQQQQQQHIHNQQQQSQSLAKPDPLTSIIAHLCTLRSTITQNVLNLYQQSKQYSILYSQFSPRHSTSDPTALSFSPLLSLQSHPHSLIPFILNHLNTTDYTSNINNIDNLLIFISNITSPNLYKAYVLITLFSALQVQYYDAIAQKYNLTALTTAFPSNPTIKPLHQLINLLFNFNRRSQGNKTDTHHRGDIANCSPISTLSEVDRTSSIRTNSQHQHRDLVNFHPNTKTSKSTSTAKKSWYRPAITQHIDAFSKAYPQLATKIALNTCVQRATDVDRLSFIHVIDLIISHYIFHPASQHIASSQVHNIGVMTKNLDVSRRKRSSTHSIVSSSTQTSFQRESGGQTPNTAASGDSTTHQTDGTNKNNNTHLAFNNTQNNRELMFSHIRTLFEASVTPLILSILSNQSNEDLSSMLSKFIHQYTSYMYLYFQQAQFNPSPLPRLSQSPSVPNANNNSNSPIQQIHSLMTDDDAVSRTNTTTHSSISTSPNVPDFTSRQKNIAFYIDSDTRTDTRLLSPLSYSFHPFSQQTSSTSHSTAATLTQYTFPTASSLFTHSPSSNYDTDSNNNNNNNNNTAQLPSQTPTTPPTSQQPQSPTQRAFPPSQPLLSQLCETQIPPNPFFLTLLFRLQYELYREESIRRKNQAYVMHALSNIQHRQYVIPPTRAQPQIHQSGSTGFATLGEPIDGLLAAFTTPSTAIAGVNNISGTNPATGINIPLTPQSPLNQPSFHKFSQNPPISEIDLNDKLMDLKQMSVEYQKFLQTFAEEFSHSLHFRLGTHSYSRLASKLEKPNQNDDHAKQLQGLITKVFELKWNQIVGKLESGQIRCVTDVSATADGTRDEKREVVTYVGDQQIPNATVQNKNEYCDVDNKDVDEGLTARIHSIEDAQHVVYHDNILDLLHSIRENAAKVVQNQQDNKPITISDNYPVSALAPSHHTKQQHQLDNHNISLPTSPTFHHTPGQYPTFHSISLLAHIHGFLYKTGTNEVLPSLTHTQHSNQALQRSFPEYLSLFQSHHQQYLAALHHEYGNENNNGNNGRIVPHHNNNNNNNNSSSKTPVNSDAVLSITTPSTVMTDDSNHTSPQRQSTTSNPTTNAGLGLHSQLKHSSQLQRPPQPQELSQTQSTTSTPTLHSISASQTSQISQSSRSTCSTRSTRSRESTLPHTSIQHVLGLSPTNRTSVSLIQHRPRNRKRNHKRPSDTNATSNSTTPSHSNKAKNTQTAITTQSSATATRTHSPKFSPTDTTTAPTTTIAPYLPLKHTVTSLLSSIALPMMQYNRSVIQTMYSFKHPNLLQDLEAKYSTHSHAHQHGQRATVTHHNQHSQEQHGLHSQSGTHQQSHGPMTAQEQVQTRLRFQLLRLLYQTLSRSSQYAQYTFSEFAPSQMNKISSNLPLLRLQIVKLYKFVRSVHAVFLTQYAHNSFNAMQSPQQLQQLTHHDASPLPNNYPYIKSIKSLLTLPEIIHNMSLEDYNYESYSDLNNINYSNSIFPGFAERFKISRFPTRESLLRAQHERLSLIQGYDPLADLRAAQEEYEFFLALRQRQLSPSQTHLELNNNVNRNSTHNHQRLQHIPSKDHSVVDVDYAPDDQFGLDMNHGELDLLISEDSDQLGMAYRSEDADLGSDDDNDRNSPNTEHPPRTSDNHSHSHSDELPHLLLHNDADSTSDHISLTLATPLATPTADTSSFFPPFSQQTGNLCDFSDLTRTSRTFSTRRNESIVGQRETNENHQNSETRGNMTDLTDFPVVSTTLGHDISMSTHINTQPYQLQSVDNAYQSQLDEITSLESQPQYSHNTLISIVGDGGVSNPFNLNADLFEESPLNDGGLALPPQRILNVLKPAYSRGKIGPTSNGKSDSATMKEQQAGDDGVLVKAGASFLHLSDSPLSHIDSPSTTLITALLNKSEKTEAVRTGKGKDALNNVPIIVDPSGSDDSSVDYTRPILILDDIPQIDVLNPLSTPITTLSQRIKPTTPPLLKPQTMSDSFLFTPNHTSDTGEEYTIDWLDFPFKSIKSGVNDMSIPPFYDSFAVEPVITHIQSPSTSRNRVSSNSADLSNLDNDKSGSLPPFGPMPNPFSSPQQNYIITKGQPKHVLDINPYNYPHIPASLHTFQAIWNKLYTFTQYQLTGSQTQLCTTFPLSHAELTILLNNPLYMLTLHHMYNNTMKSLNLDEKFLLRQHFLKKSQVLFSYPNTTTGSGSLNYFSSNQSIHYEAHNSLEQKSSGSGKFSALSYHHNSTFESQLNPSYALYSMRNDPYHIYAQPNNLIYWIANYFYSPNQFHQDAIRSMLPYQIQRHIDHVVTTQIPDVRTIVASQALVDIKQMNSVQKLIKQAITDVLKNRDVAFKADYDINDHHVENVIGKDNMHRYYQILSILDKSEQDTIDFVNKSIPSIQIVPPHPQLAEKCENLSSNSDPFINSTLPTITTPYVPLNSLPPVAIPLDSTILPQSNPNLRKRNILQDFLHLFAYLNKDESIEAKTIKNALKTIKPCELQHFYGLSGADQPFFAHFDEIEDVDDEVSISRSHNSTTSQTATQLVSPSTSPKQRTITTTTTTVTTTTTTTTTTTRTSPVPTPNLSTPPSPTNQPLTLDSIFDSLMISLSDSLFAPHPRTVPSVSILIPSKYPTSSDFLSSIASFDEKLTRFHTLQTQLAHIDQFQLINRIEMNACVDSEGLQTAQSGFKSDQQMSNSVHHRISSELQSFPSIFHDYYALKQQFYAFLTITAPHVAPRELSDSIVLPNSSIPSPRDVSPFYHFGFQSNSSLDHAQTTQSKLDPPTSSIQYKPRVNRYLHLISPQNYQSPIAHYFHKYNIYSSLLPILPPTEGHISLSQFSKSSSAKALIETLTNNVHLFPLNPPHFSSPNSNPAFSDDSSSSFQFPRTWEAYVNSTYSGLTEQDNSYENPNMLLLNLFSSKYPSASHLATPSPIGVPTPTTTTLVSPSLWAQHRRRGEIDKIHQNCKDQSRINHSQLHALHSVLPANPAPHSTSAVSHQIEPQIHHAFQHFVPTQQQRQQMRTQRDQYNEMLFFNHTDSGSGMIRYDVEDETNNPQAQQAYKQAVLTHQQNYQRQQKLSQQSQQPQP